jgi:hypothetical protein
MQLEEFVNGPSTKKKCFRANQPLGPAVSLLIRFTSIKTYNYYGQVCCKGGEVESKFEITELN